MASHTLEGCFHYVPLMHEALYPYEPFYKNPWNGAIEFDNILDVTTDICCPGLTISPRFFGVRFYGIPTNCFARGITYEKNKKIKLVFNFNPNQFFLLKFNGGCYYNYYEGEWIPIQNGVTVYGGDNFETKLAELAVYITVIPGASLTETWGVNIECVGSGYRFFIFGSSHKAYRAYFNHGNDMSTGTVNNSSGVTANLMTIEYSKYTSSRDEYSNDDEGAIFLKDFTGGIFTNGDSIYKGETKICTLTSSPEILGDGITSANCYGGVYTNRNSFCTRKAWYSYYDSVTKTTIWSLEDYLNSSCCIGGVAEVKNVLPACFIPTGEHAGKIAMKILGDTYYACLDRSTNKFKITIPY